MPYVPDRLRVISEQLRAGEAVDSVSVRLLLAFFGNDRRGRGVVATIRATLAFLGIETRPDFDTVWLDEQVHFHLISEVAPPNEGEEDTEPHQTAEVAQAPFIGGAVPDPTH